MNHPTPPNYVMPHPAEEIYLAFAGTLAVIVVSYALYLTISRRTPIPLLMWIGGLLAFMLEAPADLLTNAVYSQEGQFNAIVVRGFPVPWEVVLTYAFYASAMPIFLFDRIRAQSLTTGFWWKAYGAGTLGVAAIEQLPVSAGVWQYFGYQPFKIGLMPIGLIAANAACVIVPTVLIYRFYPLMTGWRQLAAVALIPVGTVGAWSAVHAPMSNLLGIDPEANRTLIQAGAVFTVVLSLFVAWMSITLVQRTSGAAGTLDAAEERGTHDRTATPSG